MTEKFVNVSGKRKSAVARAVAKKGTGLIRINGTRLDAYEPELARERIREPIILAGDLAKDINISINVFGGGWQGQTEAIRLVVAKGLVAFTGNKKLKRDYLDYDRQLLVADVRRKETRKPNDSKARAKRQKSYR